MASAGLSAKVGGGDLMTWRQTVSPQPVLAFIADIWTRAEIDSFDDETLAIKLFVPGHPTSPLVLDRSRYRPVDATTFPGEFRDALPRTPPPQTARAAGKPYVPLERRDHHYLSDDDAAVLAVLLAHPGRRAPFDLATAAWGVDAGNRIVDLAETIARLQEWLEREPETLEAVEADGTLWYRLLIPHSGPGTESSA
ncbi:MAG: hypothetical protein JF886_15165 [Candidatus Dormibacteraeota bacterium]|uniref:Uncharacterized protein n=1 Tax=Candidatus Aeolococcus gillhamiae TaxID=3127015 RepID=A0A2W5Z3H2_9BACT|nr:hypothetical protein [Candidatus Dormibacteraeota bacterium]PZR79792.1 MAG: hypothetical protein DLM65_09670 [Candidatus Dormibacter sp. RRmetagenome_bin12]